MAKNILTVGHTDSFGIVLSPSSHGPAYDGRVKPELVAFGEDGSSGAAAIVSGIALTLQDRYKQQNGVLPSSALVKAVLLNSADDVSRKGIDFVSGYGAANAYKAMQSISHPLNVQSTVAHGAQQQFDFNLPANIRLLKVTLAWIDPPATANASKALRNDLDLELTLPATNESWLPWVLSHFPQRDSLEKLPVRKRDSLNNVEQITIENPAAGNYRLLVRGFNVPVSSPQSFAIAIMMDTMDLFKWQYPTHTDNIFNNRYNTLRWASTFSASTGDLEYSLDQGVNWRMIQPAANLASNFIKWMPPDTFATALLRMRVGAQSFVSDTFTISNRLDVNVGFNCPDSFLLFWNSVPGVSSYSLYGLGSKYMDPVRTINDTAVILSKQSNPSLHYAIAPLLPLKTGVRSYAYNYTLQGVGCYIISFLSVLNGNNAELQLNLGTLYRVNRIVLQKWNGSQFVDLQQVTSLPGLSISFSDNTLLQGLNRYRAVIFLTDGRMILSDITDLYFSSGLEYLIFPNPARATENLQVLAMEGTEDSRLVVFNSIGQKVYDKKN